MRNERYRRSSIEPVENLEKKILSAIWINHETKEEVEEGDVGAEVNILVQTQNYKQGEVIFLDITEKDDGEVKEGKTLVTVSGIVKADGTAELKKPHTI